MKAVNEFRDVIEDLAGHWNDSVVEMLQAISVEKVSVDLELGLWRLTSEVLRDEVEHRNASRLGEFPVMEILKARTVAKVALLASRKFDLRLDFSKVQRSAGKWEHLRRSTATERVLYSRIIREPVRLSRMVQKLPARKPALVGM